VRAHFPLLTDTRTHLAVVFGCGCFVALSWKIVEVRVVFVVGRAQKDSRNGVRF